MRIALMIRKWVPANIITEGEVECYERRAPPTAVAIVITSGTPRPIVVVIDPTAVVIRSPAPWFRAHPRPAVWLDPAPSSITIRGPVVVDIDYGCVRSPNPAVVVDVSPVAICVEVFSAPHVIVVILNVIMQTFGQESLATINPVVPRIRSACCDKLPIAGISTFIDQLSRASITQSKTRCFRIDSRPPAIARTEAHTTIT
jgi:hypothetical protein